MPRFAHNSYNSHSHIRLAAYRSLCATLRVRGPQWSTAGVACFLKPCALRHPGLRALSGNPSTLPAAAVIFKIQASLPAGRLPECHSSGGSPHLSHLSSHRQLQLHPGCCLMLHASYVGPLTRASCATRGLSELIMTFTPSTRSHTCTSMSPTSTPATRTSGRPHPIYLSHTSEFLSILPQYRVDR